MFDILHFEIDTLGSSRDYIKTIVKRVYVWAYPNFSEVVLQTKYFMKALHGMFNSLINLYAIVIELSYTWLSTL